MERLTEKVYGFAQIKKCGNDFCKETCAEYDEEKSCNNCPIQEAIEKLTEYEDLEEQGKLYRGWIPCSERLPETDDYILVSFENFTIADIGRYEMDEEGGTFYPGDDDKSYVSHGLFVNAWQPLPEPYKPEEKECEEGEKMGREILFRGKRISDGQWIEGDLSRCVVVGETHIHRIEDNLSTTTHRIDPKTVCWYTGLTDKNGREIWENDIIQYGKKFFRVVWIPECAHFAAHPLEESSWSPGMNVGTVKAAEVIGNIFDNPELLEEHNEKENR